MAGIFISYRRDDSQGFAGRLADDLTDVLGSELVFRDVEIPVGHDYTDVLHRAVAICDVLIVVIGRNWQAVANQGSKSRLFDPTDWVRIEIEAAFEQGKKVIPVLVGGTNMCHANELPQSIEQLSKIQAFVMSDRRWDEDILELVTLLRKEVPSLKTKSSRKHQKPTESPAEVLRELGERVLDEVIKPRRRARRYEIEDHYLRPGFVRKILKFVQNTMTTILILVLIYFSIRLFGDAEMLRTLDKFESRLQIGWDRLLTYLKNQS